MKRPFVATVMAVAMLAGIAPLPTSASAQPVVVAPFFFTGHRYCWYEGAWNGPGWYWCGYAWRRGFGWGGGYGWRGHGGRFHGEGYHGGGGFHGRGGFHGGGGHHGH
jgi:hypothetical protein